MKKVKDYIWAFLSHFKYHIVIVVGVLFVVFIDENSMIQRFKYEREIDQLKAEIEKYTKRYEADSRRLHELQKNPDAIAKIARERYFMKTDNEDIFVLSDDVDIPVKAKEEGDEETE